MLLYKIYSFSTELAEYQDFPIFFVSYEETNGYLLDKDHRQQTKIIELSRSVKRAWSPVETLCWEFFLYEDKYIAHE